MAAILSLTRFQRLFNGKSGSFSGPMRCVLVRGIKMRRKKVPDLFPDGANHRHHSASLSLPISCSFSLDHPTKKMVFLLLPPVLSYDFQTIRLRAFVTSARPTGRILMQGKMNPSLPGQRQKSVSVRVHTHVHVKAPRAIHFKPPQIGSSRHS